MKTVATNRDRLFEVSQGTAGFELPEEFESTPLDHLRFVDGLVVDVSAHTSFWIDEAGNKHAVQVDGWQQLDCSIDDPLIKTADGWKIGTASDLLAKALSEKWEAIKVERDRLTQNGGYPLDGFWFHSDAYSLSQQQGLILAAMQVQASGGDMNAPLMATPWYAMGSVPVVMTASLAMRLLPAAMAQQVAIFEAAKAHKVVLEASADPASYDFSEGWPQVFGK